VRQDRPVVALSVQEGLGVAIQGPDGVAGVVSLLRFVQRHEEGGLLDDVQRLLVPPPAEIRVARVGPRCSGGEERRGEESETMNERNGRENYREA